MKYMLGFTACFSKFSSWVKCLYNKSPHDHSSKDKTFTYMYTHTHTHPHTKYLTSVRSVIKKFNSTSGAS